MTDAVLRLTERHIDDEGTAKYLWTLHDGRRVETVFFSHHAGPGQCLSTQTGCAIGCTFCATALQRPARNLSADEIYAQAVRVDEDCRERGLTVPWRFVTLSGMGEPLLNYDQVLVALRLMLDDNAYGLSRRRVTVSTSGVVPMMDRLAQDCPVALAVSLHAPNDALRDQLVPLNRKYPLDDLLAACERYLAHAPRDFITFEYVMLDGINDADSHARELVDIARRVSCKFNLIPFNPFPESGLKRSPPARVNAFAQRLMDAGVVTTIRKTRGDDIAAACGQLAGEVRDRTRLRERAAVRGPIPIKELRA